MRPWPQFRRVAASYSLLDHDYQAFYAKFEKRYADGWQFLVSYTLAKSDTTELWTRNTEPSGWDSSFPGYTRVTHPGGTDRRHRLVTSGILVLPGDIRGLHDPGLPLAASGAGHLREKPERRRLRRRPGARFQRRQQLRLPRSRSGSRQLLSAIHRPGSGELLQLFRIPECDFRVSRTFYFGGDYGVEAVFQVLNAFDRANFDVPLGNLSANNFGNNENSLAANINAPRARWNWRFASPSEDGAGRSVFHSARPSRGGRAGGHRSVRDRPDPLHRDRGGHARRRG